VTDPTHEEAGKEVEAIMRVSLDAAKEVTYQQCRIECEVHNQQEVY
jgi:hypothetical protein